MRKRLLLTTSICGVLALSLAACVPAAEQNEASRQDTGPAQTIAPIAGAEGVTMADIYAFNDAQGLAWAPKVITMEGGTQVQRTPDSGSDALYGGSASTYNTQYLNADNRGCDSCHTDGLADLVDSKLSYTHYPLNYGLGSVIDVKDCIYCHDEQDTVTPVKSFGQLIHGIHSRETFDGDCMSCHAATSDGEGLTLWELAKYDSFFGINKVESVTGDFSFDQTTLGGSPVWTWWPSLEGVESGATGAMQNPVANFEDWEINVSGDVDNPYTITLAEAVEQAPSETFYSSLQCVITPASGEFVGNFEVTGIPLSWFAEQAGLANGAQTLRVVSTDGGGSTVPLSNLQTEGGWLIYKINGENLTNLQGGPCRAWFPEHGAPSSRRWISDIVVGSDLSKVHYYEGGGVAEEETAGGPWIGNDELKYTWATKPNVAFCNTYEGEIIPVGQPYAFEGWADAFNEQVVAIEFSADGGETWTRFDTSSSDKKAWVYWHFNWTPEEEGAYVLSVRAVTDQGNINPYPDQIMVNAK